MKCYSGLKYTFKKLTEKADREQLNVNCAYDKKLDKKFYLFTAYWAREMKPRGARKKMTIGYNRYPVSRT